MTCVPWKRIHVDRPLLLLWLTARMAPLIPRVRLVLLVLSPCIWLILPPLISRICLLLRSTARIAPRLSWLIARVRLLLLWLTGRITPCLSPLISGIGLLLLLSSPWISPLLPPLISGIGLLLLSSPWMSPLLPPLLGRISLLLLLIALRLLISWHLVRLLRGRA